MGEKLSLYDLTTEHHLIMDAIEEAGGEITPEIEAMLAINAENFLTKAEGYAEIISKYTILAENAKTRKAQCDRVQKIAENAVKRIKERIAQAMEEYNLPKVEIGMALAMAAVWRRPFSAICLALRAVSSLSMSFQSCSSK